MAKQKIISLDYLIRPRQHVGRNRQADLIRCFQIYHKLELGRLLDRQIGGLASLQDSVHILCHAPVAVREVRPVVHEPTSLYSFSAEKYRR